MRIWKLISHHEQGSEAFDEFCERGVVSVGWSEIGDLASRQPSSSREIASWIRGEYPHLNNSQTGGPSLWNFYAEMQLGDHVIVASQGHRFGVFQITGNYEFCSEASAVLGYRNLRSAQLTNLNADELWAACGRQAAPGHAIRWTVALLEESQEATRQVFEEGHQYSTVSTVVERNPHARQKCLMHHGTTCLVCGFVGEEVFGVEGRDLIHVHHLVEVASRSGPYKLDPKIDLAPLCPNCHAMAHRRKPAYTLEDLRKMGGY